MKIGDIVKIIADRSIYRGRTAKVLEFIDTCFGLRIKVGLTGESNPSKRLQSFKETDLEILK
jgi:ribosomal protein L21E